MDTPLTYLQAAASILRARLAAVRRTKDAGYTSETVVVIALLVILAIGVVAIIAAKVTAKANSINLG